MPKINPVEPYWEEDPDNIADYEIHWTTAEPDAAWHPYADVVEATEQQAITFLQEIRKKSSTSGAKFRLTKTARKIYHDGGF